MGGNSCKHFITLAILVPVIQINSEQSLRYINTGNPGMDTLLSTVDMRVSTLDMHVSTLDRRVSKLSKNI